ncbi:hypothetical protein B0T14DRAFT_425163 [Immersiella caudata]|uniref:DUF3626 domain-containing protein n=1 Tax=Immersiella caudata TaxID=314043 RepID=A0AA40C3Y6_9PEZI|nr:hypothetical protein B0T14DRAFT_425163 [Immersiella caudata]
MAPALHPSQTAAIAHIHSTPLTLRSQSLEMINHVLYMANCLPTSSTRTALLSAIRRTARVALHFHPDRPVGDFVSPTVASSLLADGIYRSQFETGISNGGHSARPGGARDEWERSLFGGAYHADGWEDEEGEWRGLRPKYGALDILGVASDGPAPRFGSCCLVLRREVLERCTFTFGGSQDEPKWRGTMEMFDGVLAGALEDAFMRETTMGVRGEMRPSGLVKAILARGEGGEGERVRTGNLDYYVEVQVHGEVRLERDVESLVADPSFRGSEVGEEMEKLAEKFGFPLWWHVGSVIGAEEVPSDFRGPTVPSLAQRVAKDGAVTAKDIGDAVRELARDPEAWKERGSQSHVMQELKWLWHVLVRYGKPFDG